MFALPTAVHSLSEGQNVDETGVREWRRGEDHRRATKALEFLLLLAYEREPLEERDDGLDDVGQSLHLEVPPVLAAAIDLAAAEVLLEELQRQSVMLRDVEGWADSPGRGAPVLHATADDHEAAFTQRESGQEVPDALGNTLDGKPFLLIVRTRHIVTVGRGLALSSVARYYE